MELFQTLKGHSRSRPLQSTRKVGRLQKLNTRRFTLSAAAEIEADLMDAVCMDDSERAISCLRNITRGFVLMSELNAQAQTLDRPPCEVRPIPFLSEWVSKRLPGSNTQTNLDYMERSVLVPG